MSACMKCPSHHSLLFLFTFSKLSLHIAFVFSKAPRWDGFGWLLNAKTSLQCRANPFGKFHQGFVWSTFSYFNLDFDLRLDALRSSSSISSEHNPTIFYMSFPFAVSCRLPDQFDVTDIKVPHSKGGCNFDPLVHLSFALHFNFCIFYTLVFSD